MYAKTSKMTDTMPSGYLSDTEYSFSVEETDAILQVAAFHRRDFSLSVVWFPNREHAGVRASIGLPFQTRCSAGLGSLDKLPTELLDVILSRLDLYSFFKFRQVNRRSRYATDAMKQYQIAVSHGLNPLCALLRTRSAVNISLADFYEALCAKTCVFCGEFGGFVSLVTWSRCCFPCAQEAPETQVQTLASARKQFHLEKAAADGLRSLKTLPGMYTMEENVCKLRVWIVATHHAILASGRQPRDLVQTLPANSAQRNKLNSMASCALPYYDRRTGYVERGVSCAGCELNSYKSIPLGSENWAPRSKTRRRALDRVYSQDGFLEHFRWCHQAQLLWESSDRGSRRPAELPVMARRGGCFDDRE